MTNTFNIKARKVHLVMCLVGVLVFPLFAFFDYYTTPRDLYWAITSVRLGITIFIGIWMILAWKYQINHNTLGITFFLLISWFCVIITALSPKEQLYQHNIATCAVFLGASLFALWNWRYSAMVVVSTTIVYYISVLVFSDYSFMEVILAGGSLLFPLMILHPFILFLRVESKLRVENLMTEIELSNRQLLLTKNETELSNIELLKTKEELDISNRNLIEINHKLEDLVQNRTQTLERTNIELRKALEELDQFLYSSFHDFKGPIARLKGLASLSKEYVDQKTHNQYHNLNIQSIEEMEQMLTKLKTIHDIYHSKVSLELFKLQELINSMKNDPKFNFVHFEINIEDSMVQTDRNLLNIILEKIIENSLQYSKPDVPLQINISSNFSDKGFSLKIRDNGEGIPEEIKNKIFQMFYRGSKRSKGHGLGLFAAQKAIEKLNGTIKIESKESEFTQVELYFN